MGWARGSILAEEVWDAVRPKLKESDRKNVANKIIDAFENMDCDTMDECEQLMDDARRPVRCWDCGREFARASLSEDGLCNTCEKSLPEE